jgi:hypothetical protein
MDGIVVICIAIVLYAMYRPAKHSAPVISEDVIRIEMNPRLNPEMLHTEDAFMRIAHELGF